MREPIFDVRFLAMQMAVAVAATWVVARQPMAQRLLATSTLATSRAPGTEPRLASTPETCASCKGGAQAVCSVSFVPTRQPPQDNG